MEVKEVLFMSKGHGEDSYAHNSSFAGRIYISETRPRVVKDAYLAQFQADVLTFLKFRSEEMIDNGRLVLGFIEEEKLDTLNVPYYTASLEEIQGIVNEEGSFQIEHMEIIEIDVGETSLVKGPHSKGRKLAKRARSFTGSIISHHLGEEIMDKLYGEKLPIFTGDDLAKGRRKGVSIIAVLKKHVP
ncbi:hypothetical protein NL676_004999 [Syzygium grande]|nr:hypothetical protein NL676_004999 [Syzygium grande]